MAKINRMIGNIPAARVTDESGGWLFELRTDGIVTWMRPDKMDEGIERFCNSFKVDDDIKEEVAQGLRTSKVPMELMEKVFWHGDK